MRHAMFLRSVVCILLQPATLTFTHTYTTSLSQLDHNWYISDEQTCVGDSALFSSSKPRPAVAQQHYQHTVISFVCEEAILKLRTAEKPLNDSTYQRSFLDKGEQWDVYKINFTPKCILMLSIKISLLDYMF